MIVGSVLYLVPTRVCEPTVVSNSSIVMKVSLTTKGIPWGFWGMLDLIFEGDEGVRERE